MEGLEAVGLHKQSHGTKRINIIKVLALEGRGLSPLDSPESPSASVCGLWPWQRNASYEYSMTASRAVHRIFESPEIWWTPVKAMLHHWQRSHSTVDISVSVLSS